MSRGIRIVLCAPAFGCMLAASAIGARGEVAPEARGYYDACINEASSTHDIIQTGGHFIYSCFGGSAQKYYEYLVARNMPETVDKQRTGTYIFRAIPEVGRCWNKVENVDNITTSSFGCSINVTKRPN